MFGTGGTRYRSSFGEIGMGFVGDHKQLPLIGGTWFWNVNKCTGNKVRDTKIMRADRICSMSTAGDMEICNVLEEIRGGIK
jgi:hypothetical protein